MASDESSLNIIRSPAAIDELHEIWRWNAEHYGVAHADQYLRFLSDAIGDLATNYLRGKAVASRSDLRYVITRIRAKGHGHVVVYNFDATDVHVLHVFHTAQDWRPKLVDEPQ